MTSWCYVAMLQTLLYFVCNHLIVLFSTHQVTVNTWDENLFLIVPSCRFSPTESGALQYEFWANNCPRSRAMPVSYYNLGTHTWGMQFTVPLFQVMKTFIFNDSLTNMFRAFRDRLCCTVAGAKCKTLGRVGHFPRVLAYTWLWQSQR